MSASFEAGGRPGGVGKIVVLRTLMPSFARAIRRAPAEGMGGSLLNAWVSVRAVEPWFTIHLYRCKPYMILQEAEKRTAGK